MIEKAEWLWSLLRRPYHLLLNFGGRGVTVMVGGECAISMPPDFSGGEWERYEPEAVARCAAWAKCNPRGILLDLGSALGIFSAVALFADHMIEVVAFDSDINSLAATRRMCHYAPGNRLRLVYGFVAEAPTERTSLDSAIVATLAEMGRTGVRGDIGTTGYVNLREVKDKSIPVRRLDDLFSADIGEGRRMLIKCDVEGAELLVLFGAKELLRRTGPDLLLSVHPLELPNYGHSVDEVRSFLENNGYGIQCIAVDHEEHWWCEFKRGLNA